MLKATGRWVLRGLAFPIFILAATWLTLTVCSAIGYLPYSDRPGPGWYPMHLPGREEMSFYFGFLVLLAPVAAIWGGAAFFAALVARRLGMNKWFISIAGALLCFLVAGICVAGAGWYIAIAGSIPLIVAVLAGLFGAFVMPRMLPVHPLKWPLALRALLSCMVVATPIYFLAAPFIPDREAQNLQVVFEKLSPGGEDISADSGLTQDQLKQLSIHGIRGTLHGAGSAYFSVGSDRRNAKITLIQSAPLNREISLAQPDNQDVIYVQRADTWVMYPESAPTLKRKLTCSAGSSGWELHCDVEGH